MRTLARLLRRLADRMDPPPDISVHDFISAYTKWCESHPVKICREGSASLPSPQQRGH